MEKNKKNSFFLLHFIVFLWGFTPILGKLITLNALELVWWRILLAIFAIFIYLIITRVPFQITTKNLVKFAGVGIIIALHWLCFYGAIKVSNVAVTMTAFSSATLFSAFIEPIFFKRKLNWIEIACGLVIIFAIAMIFSIETRYALGLILGILAAVGSALFSVFNGILVKDSDSRIISFYEMLSGLFFLSIYLLLSGSMNASFFSLSSSNLTYLLILSFVCTAFTFIASVEIMKVISPYTVNLAVNLETVYGIILAYFIFGEEEKMTIWFYVGALIILLAIFGNAFLKNYYKK